MSSMQGSFTARYSLNQLGVLESLIYENFVYLSMLGPVECPTPIVPEASTYSIASSKSQYHLPHTSGSTATLELMDNTVVLDVSPESKRVILSTKLWFFSESPLTLRSTSNTGNWSGLPSFSQFGHFFHEGSALPHDPRDPVERRFSRHQLCLDVRPITAMGVGFDTTAFLASQLANAGLESLDAETFRQFEVCLLCVAPYNQRRVKYQSWRMDPQVRSLLP
ncbi:unnamed protein product [Protopolystoma xenopodis]|uniref:Uncharacterized protein n=1 Tax=Protopolystoma xenopodis TaxID=117903 RepID=A0A3S5FEZ1_9PLAT|nr:unnamed protein product [Protopolystoma xenopodis]